jgi:putative membrane protein
MIHLILTLIFCVALAIFAVQNNTPVQLQFLMWKSQNCSIAVLVILSAAIGAILAFFASIPTHHRRRRQLKQRERELEELRDAISKH